MGRHPKNIVGETFGQLRVVRLEERRGDNSGSGTTAMWNCRCSCGTEIIVSAAALRRGDRISCGCLKKGRRRKDLQGMKFGNWTVLRPDEKTNSGTRWVCRCACGRESSVNTSSLLRGKSQSCLSCASKGSDLSGVRVGFLTAIKPTDRRYRESVLWECRCDCGKTCFIRSEFIRSGRAISCGCRRFVDYDGHRFLSRWEMWWYMAAKAKGFHPNYEATTFAVVLPDGSRKKHTPDFDIDEIPGLYFEVKGRQREVGMRKHWAAKLAGHRLTLWTEPDIEAWCGCEMKELYSATKVGLDDVAKLIASRVGEPQDPGWRTV